MSFQQFVIRKDDDIIIVENADYPNNELKLGRNMLRELIKDLIDELDDPMEE